MFKLPAGRIGHLQVRTTEGNGVLHLLWILRYLPGERRRRFWISQRWLSKEWERLHGAKVVWVKQYDKGPKSRRNFSRYVVTQYFADQVAIAYHSYSRKLFGFPLVKVWRAFMGLCAGVGKPRVYELWNRVLQGNRVMVRNGQTVTLESLRLGWGAT